MRGAQLQFSQEDVRSGAKRPETSQRIRLVKNWSKVGPAGETYRGGKDPSGETPNLLQKLVKPNGYRVKPTSPHWGKMVKFIRAKVGQ